MLHTLYSVYVLLFSFKCILRAGIRFNPVILCSNVFVLIFCFPEPEFIEKKNIGKAVFSICWYFFNIFYFEIRLLVFNICMFPEFIRQNLHLAQILRGNVTGNIFLAFVAVALWIRIIFHTQNSPIYNKVSSVNITLFFLKWTCVSVALVFNCSFRW